MDQNRIEKIYQFYKEIDKLKSVYRSTYLTDGSGHESDSDHAWHMGILAMLLAKEAESDLNMEKVIKMILVHDLGEVYCGDVCVYDQPDRQIKKQKEAEGFKQLMTMLPNDLAQEFQALLDEYEEKKTLEAKFVKALDTLQPFMLNVATKGRVWKEKGVNEQWSRQVNKSGLEFNPEMRKLFEELYKKTKEEKMWSKQ